jgi:hypothetical protein
VTTAQSVAALEATLAKVQAELAALRGANTGVNGEAVAKLTAAEWQSIRFNMVVHDKNNKPQLAKGRKGYELVKGADVKLYMAAKGFANTLLAQQRNGEPVGLHTEVNDKGRTQLMYATETIASLIAQGFVKPDRFISAAKKATRKSSK